ncbi:MAG: hypothetical protein JNK72_04220 [Myxococcales bacterium]|nr:hypothetical protein [Myxococcales bacterium]
MRRSSENAPSVVWLSLLAAICAFFGVNVGRTWDFTVDDAGISYSYARNLWAGHGLVLTPGAERVEAATNLLWVLLLSPADALHISHESLSKLLGLTFATLSLCAIAAFPAVAYRRRPRFYDLLAPLVTATFAHLCLWTASGLENGLFQGLAALSIALVAHEENHPSAFPFSSVSLFLLFATRPDGALYAAAVFGAKALRMATGGRRRQDALWVATLGALVAALELFRLAYFAYPFPNSFYTKKRTFDFGKDLTKFDSAGWSYVSSFVVRYKLKKALIVMPAALLAFRAPVARTALLACVGAAFFLPVYSHGDWMEEWRFLTFGMPLIALAMAEAGRSLSRIALGLTPRSLRTVMALALTPVAGYFFIAETTRAYPARFFETRHHDTLDFQTVRGRARYFSNAARRLELQRGGSVLDPDVGGMSYDSGLQVIDLFGLGDVAIARTHPVDEPGLRETLFDERRPTFVHLHGAWFGAVQLDRLEELEQAYFRLPGAIDDGHDDASNYVRRDALAAPWQEAAERGPTLSSHGPTWVDGFTLPARGVDPNQPLAVEVHLAALAGAMPGNIVAEAQRGGTTVSVALRPLGELVPPSAVLAGERPFARARLRLTAGTYTLRWRNEGGEAALGVVTVAPGLGQRDAQQRLDRLSAHLAAGQLPEARRLALGFLLQSLDEPQNPLLCEGLGRFSRHLAERARRLGEHGFFDLAALAAREAQRFALRDSATQNLIQRLAERMADNARGAERDQQIERAFTLARDAVMLDPRRSWMRRRAEDLRARRLHTYDGGRDVAAWRFAIATLAKSHTAALTAADLDPALIFLGATGHAREAALLQARANVTPVAPWARVTVARGRLVLGDLEGAAALLAPLPCATARDAELHRALEVLRGPVRRGDALCTRAGALASDAPWLRPAGLFDPREGSFEDARWQGWIAAGNAFGPGPIHDTPASQSFINGFRGQRYASSYARNADSYRGLLRSRTFRVTSPAISFLVAGGADTERVGVRLRVNGETVLSAAGNNGEGFRRVFWDVAPWLGRDAVIEVYDDADGSWGHIMADDFVAEPVYPQY